MKFKVGETYKGFGQGPYGVDYDDVVLARVIGFSNNTYSLEYKRFYSESEWRDNWTCTEDILISGEFKPLTKLERVLK